MSRRIFSGILLSLLLIGILTCVFNIQPVKAAAAQVYFSVEPVAVSPLMNINGSTNGLEIPSTPSPIGQDFTVQIHLRNATATNVPAGVEGVEVHFHFGNILSYCRPLGFTNMLGQPGGVLLGPSSSVLYGINARFYDDAGNPISASPYTNATQYIVVAATSGGGWNNADGLVAEITFQTTGQPSSPQPDFYAPLQMTYTELDDINAIVVPSYVVQGTVHIDTISQQQVGNNVAPAVEWNMTYGTSRSSPSTLWTGNSVIQTTDGGYAVMSTSDFGMGNDAEQRIWLVKTDSAGNAEWNKTYGEQRVLAASIVQTVDGGYAIAGDYPIGEPPEPYAWLVKTDSSGNIQWSKNYTELGVGMAYTMIQTNDGGFVIAGGNGYYEGWLMKTDANGTMLWSQTFGEANTQLQSVVQTSDGGYVAAGATQYPPFTGKVDAYVVKTDSDGNITWSAKFSQTTGDDYGRSIIQTSDGGYAIAGETNSFGNAHFWLIRIAASGNLLWDKTFGGTSWSGANSIIQTNDGGYILAGKTNSFGAGGNDLWLVKTDADGSMQWNETFGGAGDDGNSAVASSFVQTSDGGYALNGYSNSFSSDGSYQVWLIKLAPPSLASPPVADFMYSPGTPIANETVTFDASSSSPGWNGTQTMPLVSYTWDFGDISTATGQVATHSYETPGNFAVTLNVTDAEGFWGVIEKQVQVGQPQGPVAAFTITPQFTYVDQDIQLNASLSLAGWNGSQEDPITLYIWDFGDGNVTSGGVLLTIVHSYAYAGVFNVTLTVSDSESMSSSCSHTILIVMPTSISVSTSATSSLIGYTVGINGTLSDVYGNAIGNEPVVLYYTFPGVTSWFPITSSVTDNNGQYYVQWIPTATGTFNIMAGWAGNITYSGASSNVTLNSIPAMNQYIFSVESNSTISALAFNTTSQELSFTASGPSGTTGYAKVTIAKSLVSNITNIRVYLDNNQTEYSVASTDDSWLLMFNYTHSTHTVRVDLSTSVIPEFSNDLILFLLVTLAVTVLVAEKRKIAKRIAPEDKLGVQK